MSYASKDEIKSMFRNFADNTDAAVDDSDLDLFLANTASMIDGASGTLYSMPITEGDNPESFKILKQLQMYKVAGIVDDILNNYSEADKKPMWDRKAEMLLKALVPEKKGKNGCKQCEPTMKLPDASYLGTSTQRGRVKMRPNSGRQFSKGGNNW